MVGDLLDVSLLSPLVENVHFELEGGIMRIVFASSQFSTASSGFHFLWKKWKQISFCRPADAPKYLSQLPTLLPCEDARWMHWQ
jgi:hypothetical protein